MSIHIMQIIHISKFKPGTVQKNISMMHIKTKILPFSRGEHILLFLVQTVSRQITEQRSYCPKGIDVHSNKRRVQAAVAAAKGNPNFPDHDLEPPKFARQALELIIKEWSAVKNMVLSGAKSTEG